MPISRITFPYFISIHAAQEGCDYKGYYIGPGTFQFQSTQPKRAATTDLFSMLINRDISIHAAQEGCDKSAGWYVQKGIKISIHAAQEGCDFYGKFVA